MVRPIDVGQWLIESGEHRALHMQKIPYFAQVWSLVWTGRPLFEGTFEAWPNGPVNRDIYREFTHCRVNGNIMGADPADLTSDDVMILQSVSRFYGPMVGDLIADTSHDSAWSAARGSLPPKAASTRELDLTLALREYSLLAMTSSNVPAKPAGLTPRTFSTVEVATEAARQDMRWAEVHERLAVA